jgi:hypothetical protein
MKDTLVIDLDGPIFDYNAAYADLWQRKGVSLETMNRAAYWAQDMYNVPFLTGVHKERLDSFMNEKFWAEMNPFRGALEAVNELAERFVIVGVTTSEEKYNGVREARLKELGFKVDMCYSTGRDGGANKNPKARVINSLRPWGVIDDLPTGLLELNQTTKKFLLARNADDPKGPTHGDVLGHYFLKNVQNCSVFKFYGEYKQSGLREIADFINGFYPRNNS